MKKTIYLSAGHAGRQEEGAIVENVKEKEINEIVTNKISKLLELREDIIVIRNKEGADIKERVETANYFAVDYFLEIHCNAFEDGSVSGFESFNYPESDKGFLLSFNILNSIEENIKIFNHPALKSRGTKKSSDLYVLRKTSMPSALVELGFISNALERIMLQKEEYQNVLAFSITQGIIKEVGRG